MDERRAETNIYVPLQAQPQEEFTRTNVLQYRQEEKYEARNLAQAEFFFLQNSLFPVKRLAFFSCSILSLYRGSFIVSIGWDEASCAGQGVPSGISPRAE